MMLICEFYANLQIANIMSKLNKLIFPQLSYKINGILFAAHNELGRFCNEKQYGDTIETHLKRLRIGYEREKVVPPLFEGEIKGRHKVDFLIKDKIILEIKSKRLLTKEDYYQVKRYLIVLNKKLGLLVNFRDRYIRPRRILNSMVE